MRPFWLVRDTDVSGVSGTGVVAEGVEWRCLGTTKDGHPRHPLYVRGDQPLAPFTASEATR